MYIIKKEKSKELRQGRTIKYIAEQLGITREHLSGIFNARYTTKLETIDKILSFCIGKDYKKTDVEKYFKKIL